MHGSIYDFNALPLVGQPGARVSQPLPGRARTARAVPLVGIIRNPRSHRNRQSAPDLADCSNMLTETPDTREELVAAIAEFARRGIDYLVVDGGDGTVRDVLTCGSEVYGDDWPPIIALPKGKTNALTVDLGMPFGWELADALEAAGRGNVVQRRPLRISAVGNENRCVQGFIFGAGVYTLSIEAGQETHRWGAFNSFAVLLTILTGIVQALFGTAQAAWRTCTPMRIYADGRIVPQSRLGRLGERFLMFASTLENYPLGALPFGRQQRTGIRMGIIDWPARWMIALIPAIMFGLQSRMLRRNGMHQLHADAFEIELGGRFILDGESFPAGHYLMEQGPLLNFVVP